MKFHILIISIIVGSILSAGTIDFKQYDIDANPKDLVWCGPARDTVIVVTELNSLYRSDDKGFTWKKLNDIMTNTGKQELDDNENEVKNIIYNLINRSEKFLEF
jgi:hypothetical protein